MSINPLPEITQAADTFFNEVATGTDKNNIIRTVEGKTTSLFWDNISITFGDLETFVHLTPERVKLLSDPSELKKFREPLHRFITELTTRHGMAVFVEYVSPFSDPLALIKRPRTESAEKGPLIYGRARSPFPIGFTHYLEQIIPVDHPGLQ